MEEATPQALFSLYKLLSDEAQIAFLKLLAKASTAEAAIFFSVHLSQSEGRRFVDEWVEGAIKRIYPTLIAKAVETAREHPGSSGEELRGLLAENVRQFAEEYAAKAAEAERLKLKEQRDRKSDPVTIRRNVEICDLRKQDKKKWSYRRLARHFQITPQAIGLILKEEAKWRRLATAPSN